MTYDPNWGTDQSPAIPISPAVLRDMETRLSDYTDDRETTLVAAAELIHAPQLPGLVAPYDPRFGSGGSAMGTNGARFVRVIVPRTGTLVDLAVMMTVASGNIDVGVYNVAEPRVRLYSTGSIACPTANAWAVVGDPNIAVTAGQQLEFAIAADNATAETLRIVGSTAWKGGTLPTGFWPSPGGVAVTKLTSLATSQFPLPATIADASLVENNASVCIIARVE